MLLIDDDYSSSQTLKSSHPIIEQNLSQESDFDIHVCFLNLAA